MAAIGVMEGMPFSKWPIYWSSFIYMNFLDDPGIHRDKQVTR